MKQLILLLTDDDHKAIKVEAAKRGVTMKFLIMTALKEFLEK